MLQENQGAALQLPLAVPRNSHGPRYNSSTVCRSLGETSRYVSSVPLLATWFFGQLEKSFQSAFWVFFNFPLQKTNHTSAKKTTKFKKELCSCLPIHRNHPKKKNCSRFFFFKISGNAIPRVPWEKRHSHLSGLEFQLIRWFFVQIRKNLPNLEICSQQELRLKLETPVISSNHMFFVFAQRWLPTIHRFFTTTQLRSPG